MTVNFIRIAIICGAILAIAHSIAGLIKPREICRWRFRAIGIELKEGSFFMRHLWLERLGHGLVLAGSIYILILVLVKS
jgi:hypothetical protein